MEYKSTNNISKNVSFKTAVIEGLASDGGLFIPIRIPVLNDYRLNSLKDKSLQETAHLVLHEFIGNEIDNSKFKDIINTALNFEIPVKKIEENIYSLELFHGPTLAFKDIGARVTAQIVKEFLGDKKITVLVATSGDTGSAVANAFYELENVNVVVLYPKGMVSDIQEKQFTTLGKNIKALEVNGSFDDCQSLVKQAFADNDVKEKINPTSANSINIARMLPQMVYYFNAFYQLYEKTKRAIVFSVPSGNYGNLTAGLIAKKMGLAIDHFITSTNINDVVPQYLKTKIYTPRKSTRTLSNAMDVGNPSNFSRILELYNNSWKNMKNDMSGYGFNDDTTKKAISDCYKNTGYILDPHGAIGYLGLKEYMKENDVCGVFLETAHPAKFKDTVEDVLNKNIDIPDRLKTTLNKEKTSIGINNSYEDFKSFLLKTD